MLDQLFKLIKSQVQENSQEWQNANVPLDENTFLTIQHVLTNGLQNMDATSLQSLMEAGKNGNLTAESPEIHQLSSQFSGSISEKLGIDSGLAKTLTMSILPMILKKLFSGSSSTNSGFSLDTILGSIIGNKSNSKSDDGSVLGQLSDLGAKFGLDKDGDGDVDLNDITSMFKK